MTKPINSGLSLSRRNFLAGAATVGAVTLSKPFIISARSADTLVVNSQGGEFQPIIEETVIKPFEKKFGVQVIHDPTGSASQDYAKIRAARGAPGFDVAHNLTPPEVILGAKEKMLEPVTEREVPNLKYIWPQGQKVIPGFGVPHTYMYCALIYNKEKVKAPTSWADYWDPAKSGNPDLKGHLIAFHPNNLLAVYALLQAAELGGGGADNMEPAWEYLKKQKEYVGTVVTGSSEAVPYFENGEVWLAPYWSPRSGYYIERGMPFGMVIPTEGVNALCDVAAIPVGATNKKLAYEFLNFRLEKETQRAFSLAYHSSPGRGDIEDWPAEFAASQVVTQAQMDKLKFPDSALIGERRKDWTLRWQEIMA
ncbi:spermidine/putrescine ABC transporter substrate-binding protein [Agaricicola taiwanensis]|uniref:Spermidine/putrescine ABC transporter substrate-binding protein n=1 Tax=Agaricicola taiwanensis TaxID=591372 RepID=A0A8J2VMQ3_9RHOB|nr:extracellular solute-binding protein [Agaricicola taiwanensis]GGE31850.1 spermidine/putrescine ABC transporter substrate-binding protein [Agaricicola taiwanensis]